MIGSFDPIKSYVVKVVCNATHKYEGNISHNNLHGKFSFIINSKRIYQKKIIN